MIIANTNYRSFKSVLFTTIFLVSKPGLCDSFFSPSEVEHFFNATNSNACAKGCTLIYQDKSFKMVRLFVDYSLDDHLEGHYLVSSIGIDTGNGGEYVTIYYKTDTGFQEVRSLRGSDIDTAERLIRRDKHYGDMLRTVDKALQRDTSWAKIGVVSALIITMVISSIRLSRGTLSSLSVPYKIAVIALSSVLSGLILAAVGIDLSVTLPVTSLFFGVSIAIVFSLS